MASHLPYVDAPPPDHAVAAARSLVLTEISPDSRITTHPSLPAAYEPSFTPAVAADLSLLESGDSKPAGTGIDVSRYDSLDAPEDADTAAWTAVLRQAYASYEYLRTRQMNLGLLETYGKNAWLIGNDGLEDELRALEKEVEAARIEREQVEHLRRTEQNGVAEEMGSLTDAWRRGVGKSIETQAAAEGLRLKGLKRMRQGAK